MNKDEAIELLRTDHPAWDAYRNDHLDWAPDLRGANLYGENLYGRNLRGADLSGANLIEANLHSADLSATTWAWADLRGANLSKANVGSADLHSANLGSANLGDANFSKSKLTKHLTLPASTRAYTVYGPTPYPVTGFIDSNSQLLAISTIRWIGPTKGFLEAVKMQHPPSAYEGYSTALAYLELCAWRQDPLPDDQA